MSEKTGQTEDRKSTLRPRDRRPSRPMAILKSVVLLALLGTTAYGMIRAGLYGPNLWLPVALGAFVLLLVTLFLPGYYGDMPRAGWIMVALLAILVAVKGLSMIWTISETLTAQELLRSAMYLATFILAMSALFVARQVASVLDVSILITAAVGGYGLLQKISPIKYPVTSLDGVRVDSTIQYPNTTAIIVAMGVLLALARITQMRNPVARGVYSTLSLALLTALYLTVSRGGLVSLVIGIVVLLILGKSRLRMSANLLLLILPGAWLLWKIENIKGLLEIGVPDQQRLAAGSALFTDLLIAMAAAFVLQALYAFVSNRYHLAPGIRRAAGAIALAAVFLVFCGVVAVTVIHYGGVQQTYKALVSNPDYTQNTSRRLASVSIGDRTAYWKVAWKAWKKQPFTGTGAGTFQYTWNKDRTNFLGVKQVHNLYLEQGTETGVFAFLAIVAFASLLIGYTARAAWRAVPGDRRIFLAGLVAALVTYLLSSAVEWHWYIPASTLLFFILAGVTTKLAFKKSWDHPDGEPDTLDQEHQ
ncbi:MAG: O-antigen ligase family protein [Rubrobacteraceae bacterium]